MHALVGVWMVLWLRTCFYVGLKLKIKIPVIRSFQNREELVQDPQILDEIC